MSHVMFNTVALLALVAAPAIAQQQEEGEVAGIVVAQASQGPLADVQVSIADQPGKTATTDVSGRFRLTGVSGTEVRRPHPSPMCRASSTAARRAWW